MKKLIVDSATGKMKLTRVKEPGAEPEEVESATETQKPQVFESEPYKVTVSLDAKIGLPSYSSAGCFVSLSCPCTKDDIEETYSSALAWVEEKMAEITDGIGGK